MCQGGSLSADPKEGCEACQQSAGVVLSKPPGTAVCPRAPVRGSLPTDGEFSCVQDDSTNPPASRLRNSLRPFSNKRPGSGASQSCHKHGCCHETEHTFCRPYVQTPNSKGGRGGQAKTKHHGQVFFPCGTAPPAGTTSGVPSTGKAFPLTSKGLELDLLPSESSR